MVQIAISNLPPLPPITGSATPLGSDLIPGVDTSDLSESLAAPTTYYLSCKSSFTVDTLSVCGAIYARVRR